MAAEEHADLLALKSRLGERSALWKEMKTCESQVDLLQAKYMEVRASIGGSEEEPEKDLDTLSQKVKTAATLLTYLKTRARTMAVPRLAEASCGIKQLEGVGLVDKDGVPLSSWSKFVDLSSFDGHGYKTYTGTSDQSSLVSDKDEADLCNLLNSVHMVTNVMENLVKRVLIAESETAREKEKVYFSQEEIKKKDSQLESMSLKLKEMERCAFGTNGILNEMRQRVEDTVNKTSRQRQRAAENEQELTRVKRDFENMKSYVSSLISVRETLVSSEKQFQTIEKFFERLQNAPPVTYTEHKEEKSKRSRDIVLEEGAKPEFYTEEDEKLLGNTEMPWTFFVDGYRKDGTRIYDLVNGKTCDQCRQKTLGQRTRCFKCNLVQGQFCGDCLFMRQNSRMSRRATSRTSTASSLLSLIVAGIFLSSPASSIRSTDISSPTYPPLKVAVFALGSFWRSESAFGCLHGVVRTTVGYSGGTKPNPEYRNLADHAESVQIEYDPRILSFRQLLEVFWSSHDSRQVFGQGPDVGNQYRSIIFTNGTSESRLAAVSKEKEQTKSKGNVVTTQIQPLGIFYPAEPEHQKFELKRNPFLLHLIGNLPEEELEKSTLAAKLNSYAAELCPQKVQNQIDSKINEIIRKGWPVLKDI